MHEMPHLKSLDFIVWIYLVFENTGEESAPSCLQNLKLNYSWLFNSRNYTLLTYSMVHDIIWKADCHSSCQKISRFLMELEGSLLCSQKPCTGPYPAPANSSSPHRSLSPYHRKVLTEIYFVTCPQMSFQQAVCLIKRHWHAIRKVRCSG
jgi:hypothetical protein